jgi:hypothetical protein
LVIEGFALGAILFFAVSTSDADSPPAAPAMRAAAIVENPAA